jgi:hypothetical protein
VRRAAERPCVLAREWCDPSKLPSLLNTAEAAPASALSIIRCKALPDYGFSGFSGFSTVWSPQTAGVTDNPRPPPLSGEPPIGLGAGGKDPGPGGRPGGPLSRRRGPVARVGAQRGVLRFRLPCGASPARCAPPLAISKSGVCAGLGKVRVRAKRHIYQALYTGPQSDTGHVPQREQWPRHHPWPRPRAVIYPDKCQVIRTHVPRFGLMSQRASAVYMRHGRTACSSVAAGLRRGRGPRRSEGCHSPQGNAGLEPPTGLKPPAPRGPTSTRRSCRHRDCLPSTRLCSSFGCAAARYLSGGACGPRRGGLSGRQSR